MHNSYLFLEFHTDSTTKNFIIHNLRKFKEKGIHTLMIEMNSDKSVAQTLFELEILINMPGFKSSQHINFATSFKGLLKEAQNLNIEIMFIDPQSTTDAAKIVSLSSEERKKITVGRDIVMHQEIRKTVQKKGPGIIFLCGAMHQHIVKLVKTDHLLKDKFEIVLFTDTNLETYNSNDMKTDSYQGKILTQNREARQQFYGHEIISFNAAQNKEYERHAQTLLGLNKLQTLNSFDYYRKERLKQSLALINLVSDITFEIDSQYFVHAHFTVNNHDAGSILNKIKEAYPKYNGSIEIYSSTEVTKFVLRDINVEPTIPVSKKTTIVKP